MLTKETFVDIHVRFAQGQSIRKIARELGISRNTVKRHLQRREMPIYNKQIQPPTKLAPFEEYLIQRIEQAKPEWIPATVLFHEAVQRGYQGGIAQLRRFVRQFKSTSIPEPVVRFETLPGQQMQIDFTTIRRTKFPLKAFVATLGYSRASYIQFFDNERAESWQQGLKAAFDYFSGVPQQVLCDNAKALIIERNAYAEGKHKINAQMLQVSKDYGFELSACKPYRAKTKGKVERFNHYLKNSFIIPLKAELKAQNLELDVDIANAKVGPWLQWIAHQRIHGTTQEKPAERLIEEVKHLQPLPCIVGPSVPQTKAFEVETISQFKSADLQHSIHIYDAFSGGERVTA
ncbi:IS21 family transposase [Pseudoalteromonas rubra]|uniref:IS21 family transposase n=1 Tax=Pseudoalteromonas rubra TaxID=43658 RepID=A0A5S3WN10_9GAMM|nr:IS21 family transposase [Pseudoalteromonas rubra]TMP28582.1 IS21 family transposase [Pseudoalteromonas rubra]TMP28853.1 IS21 family transposase [Pseudoalteromonas rubra]